MKEKQDTAMQTRTLKSSHASLIFSRPFLPCIIKPRLALAIIPPKGASSSVYTRSLFSVI